MSTAIIGWHHLPFGKHEDMTVESLIVEAVVGALDHAGLEASEIDEIVLGHFNGGFSAQEFTAALVLQANPDFRFKPATRVENACATGSAAVHQAIKAIEARKARTALVVGVEQMTKAAGPQIANNLSRPPTCRRRVRLMAASPASLARLPWLTSKSMVTSRTHSPE